MKISLDAKTVFGYIQPLFMLEVLERSGIKGTQSKQYIANPLANIKLNGESLKAITLKSGTDRATHTHSLYSISYLKF